jgi:hypothetical protein
MQWRKDRYTALQALAAQQGKQWNDPSVQATHWWNEHKQQGLMGSQTPDEANDATIDSLRPAGWKANADTNAGVMHYSQRLANTNAALQALGIAAPQGASPADMPAPGAQEAQQIVQQPQRAPQPTLSDSLGRLSSAFFMRDSPTQAKAITDDLNTRMAQQQALLKAQQVSNQWTTKPEIVTGANGKSYRLQYNAQGQTRTAPVAPEEVPKEESPEKTRQEVMATEKLGIAENTLGQIDRVRGSIQVLREALQHGTFQLGPDQQGKMVLQNITGNSDESTRFLKSMESQIIEAATAMAATQKGALTNFKFAKDMQAVMPSFANHDRKAAYEALERVSHGLDEGYNATANTALNHAKGFERLQKKLDPTTGEDVDINTFYRNKIKENAEREAAMKAKRAEFMASPGRGQSATPGAPAVGFVKGGYRFTGGNPADQKSWQKVD